MRHPIGKIVTVAAAIAATVTLTACDRPLPKITVLSGSTTVVLGPQTYCFDATHCHHAKGNVPTIHAVAGATLLIDVPRDVASHSWSVSSGTFVSADSFQSFQGENYSSGTVKNSHSARVDVPYGVGTYAIAVQTNGLSAWVANVSVSR